VNEFRTVNHAPNDQEGAYEYYDEEEDFMENLDGKKQKQETLEDLLDTRLGETSSEEKIDDSKEKLLDFKTMRKRIQVVDKE
jgi:hypothetical protein